MAADLIQKWKRNNQVADSMPGDYQPEVCPPDQAEEWTNTENPGNSDHGKWEWDRLVDLAYVADSNPNTIQDGVKTLLEGLLEGETAQ